MSHPLFDEHRKMRGTPKDSLCKAIRTVKEELQFWSAAAHGAPSDVRLAHRVDDALKLLSELQKVRSCN